MPNAIVRHVWLAAENCEEVLLQHKKFKLFLGVHSKPAICLGPDEIKPTGVGSMHDPN
jgi:hypothetical protein